MISEWEKGGLRYAKLKKLVPEFMAPSRVEVFFVGVKGRRRISRLLNPLSPFQREYVIAATVEGLVVLRLRRPGVFRASISGIVCREEKDAVRVRWEGGLLTVGGSSYSPISFHERDAEQLASLFAPAA